MFERPRPEFVPEFVELAVRRVKSEMTIGAVAAELGLVERTLHNLVKAADVQLHPRFNPYAYGLLIRPSFGKFWCETGIHRICRVR